MSSAVAIFAILASAVVVLSGMLGLARAIWSTVQDLRDNKTATMANTRAVAELSQKMDDRISSLETRVSDLERGR